MRPSHCFTAALAVALYAALAFVGPRASAEPSPAHAPAKVPPLKVVVFTGGCCHDYAKLGPFLTAKLGELVNAEFTIKNTVDALKDPKFADGYDAIIYDICWKQAELPDWKPLLEATRAGKPVLALHCTAHALRPAPDWSQMLGMTSHVHDKFGPFEIEKTEQAKDNPALKDFPDHWKTKGDELYNTDMMQPDAVPLLTAKSPASGKTHVVCWSHQYGKGKVFATTLGHDMNTTADGDYLKLLAHGLLWACDKLDKDGKPVEGYAGPGPKDAKGEKGK